MLDEKATQLARKVAGRAILRLGLLEVAMLVMAVFLCLLAGAVIALLVTTSFGVSFRWTWSVASLLLFLVPALVAWRREKSTL
jgi:hypothetical protein